MVSLSVDLSVDFTQGLNDAWSKVAQFVPQLVAFLVILVVGWFVSKLIARVFDRALRKVGSERLSERAGTSRLLQDSSYDLTGILRRIVYYALMLLTLQFAPGAPNTPASRRRCASDVRTGRAVSTGVRLRVCDVEAAQERNGTLVRVNGSGFPARASGLR